VDLKGPAEVELEAGVAEATFEQGTKQGRRERPGEEKNGKK